MTSPTLDHIVNAVLYDGYVLYPHRAASKQNPCERFTFGRIYPKDYSDSQPGAEPCLNQTECLFQAHHSAPVIKVTVRFLHPMWREAGYITDRDETSFQAASAPLADAAAPRPWQEASEREVSVSLHPAKGRRTSRMESSFSFHSSRVLELLPDDLAIQRWQETLDGLLETRATPLGAGLFKITARVLNQTPISDPQCADPNAIMMRTFASAHTILRATGGEFISMRDTPPGLESFAGQCKNIGTWPVLVGDESRSERDTLLSSPIVLCDYPQITPEIRDDLFGDETGIDDMPALRAGAMANGDKPDHGGRRGMAESVKMKNMGRTPPSPFKM